MASQQLKLSSPAIRVFALLEEVARYERPVSQAEVIATSGLPKPTVYRLLSLLQRLGMLLREPKGKGYTVGPRLSALAVEVLMNSAPRAPRHAVLRALVDEIGETCNMTMLDGDEVVYIDRVETAWPLRAHLQPGSRVPIHCTASGKLFLSQLPARRRRHLMQAAPLKRYTETTITEPKKLERALARIRAEGFSTDNEEWLAGMIAVAVPVLDESGRVYAAVAVHAPEPRMTLEQAKRHLPALRRAADALSRL